MSVVALITAAKLLIWLQVAVGLGLVIFVHELGHFVVAKLCGVKCEKFYLGFDIYGLKLLKFKWGETEYGIGVLPLGGYVKMLGQEDNPTKAYEEMQRAKGRPTAEPAVETWAEDRIAEAEGATYDPRSYLAQSVPERMAIISAGVIMNLIFAFLLAIWAYQLGVEYQPCVISGVVPAQPAWEADLKVGDEIVAIGDLKSPRYTDLMASVALGNLKEGVKLTVKRGADAPFTTLLHPTRALGIPKIGIAPPRSVKLFDRAPTVPDAAAAKADPPLAGGDIITAVNGEPVESYADLDRLLARHASEELRLELAREPKQAEPGKPAEPEKLTTTIGVNPVRVVGIEMQLGPISGVQEGSPAAKAGFKAGEQIVAVDGQGVGDPMTLPVRLAKRVGETATFRVKDKDNAERDIAVELPPIESYEWPKLPVPDVPREISGLGLAYKVLNRIAAVDPEGPAGKAGITPSDEILSVTLTPPADQSAYAEAGLPTFKAIKVDFAAASAPKDNWVYLLGMLQSFPEGTKLDFALRGDRTVSLSPSGASDWFNPERGFNLAPLLATRRAENLQEAMVLGGRELLDAVLQVYRFLQKLGHQIPATEMGGPLTIFQTAGQAASVGFSQLLIFLVMLSANLAVLNFLPIPMLDGGHMVFLILEGIRRKPVSEKMVLAFHYAGFLFIVSLMCFVLFLDVRRLFG